MGNEYFYQRASLIGRFTYGFDNRYFLETSFRVDGSTKLPPENRWGFFPTVSGAWVLSNESFFRSWDQPVISTSNSVPRPVFWVVMPYSPTSAIS